LEDIRLSGDLHSDRLNHLNADFEDAIDLVSGDIAISLGQEASTTKRIVALELSEVVNVRIFIDYLIVTDVTVTLSGEEENVGIRVEERNDDTRASIEIGAVQRLGEITRIPDGVLTLRSLGETRGEESVAATKEANASSLNTLVGNSFGGDAGLTRINHTDFLVLARGGHDGTVEVPVEGLNEVTVLSLEAEDVLALFNIPNLDCEIGSGGGEDVVGGRVELHATDLSLVTIEGLERVVHIGGETTSGDTPDLASAILRDGCNQTVVERVEVDIENSALVTSDGGHLGVNLSLGSVGDDTERATTTALKDDGEVETVGSDEVGIPGTSGDTELIIAILLLVNLAVNVAVLGRTYNARHRFK